MTEPTANPQGAPISLPARLSILMVAPLSGLAQSGLSPILPRISEHFAGEPGADTLVRLLVSSVTAAMAFGSLVGGFLAGRFGQRQTLIWTLAAFAVAGCSGFLLDNLAALLVSRIVLGVFTAAAGVVVAAIITTRIAEHRRDSWLGYMTVAGTFGAIALLLLAGALGARDWRLVFLLYALAVPVLALIAVLLPGDAEIRREKQAAGPAPFPYALTFVGIAVGGVAATSVVFLPYYLAAIGEGNPQRIAAAILPNAIAGGLIAFGYGWLRKKLGIIPIFLLGFALAAAGMLEIVAVGTYFGALVGMVLVGAGVGVLAPNIISATANAAAPERRARTIGYVRAGFYSGPMLAQLALEPLSLNYGASSALVALGVFMVAMFCLTLAGRRLIQ